jgi:hypothetical protein
MFAGRWAALGRSGEQEVSIEASKRPACFTISHGTWNARRRSIWRAVQCDEGLTIPIDPTAIARGYVCGHIIQRYGTCLRSSRFWPILVILKTCNLAVH